MCVHRCGNDVETYIFRAAMILPPTVLQMPHPSHFFARTWESQQSQSQLQNCNKRNLLRLVFNEFDDCEKRTVCELQRCCCVRTRLRAEPENQPGWECWNKFDKNNQFFFIFYWPLYKTFDGETSWWWWTLPALMKIHHSGANKELMRRPGMS